ncbi:MAG: prepilin peptidase [Erysipelotrichaceae bacterium]|nr:prepilin peptidase [Erysipelotrichaceae bacterium]
MFVITLAITFIFIIMSLLDYDTMYVNDIFQLILLIIVIISMFFYKVSLLDRILGTIFLTIPLYLINHFKECIGGADLKLITIMGWMLGFYDALIGFSIGVIIASLFSIIMLLLNKVTLKTFIPLIPFLCIGFYISLINIQIWPTYFI